MGNQEVAHSDPNYRRTMQFTTGSWQPAPHIRSTPDAADALLLLSALAKEQSPRKETQKRTRILEPKRIVQPPKCDNEPHQPSPKRQCSGIQKPSEQPPSMQTIAFQVERLACLMFQVAEKKLQVEAYDSVSKCASNIRQMAEKQRLASGSSAGRRQASAGTWSLPSLGSHPMRIPNQPFTLANSHSGPLHGANVQWSSMNPMPDSNLQNLRDTHRESMNKERVAHKQLRAQDMQETTKQARLERRRARDREARARETPDQRESRLQKRRQLSHSLNHVSSPTDHPQNCQMPIKFVTELPENARMPEKAVSTGIFSPALAKDLIGGDEE